MQSGTKSIAFLVASYLAIWSIAIWLARTTPREFLSVSISHDGTLALTSWSKFNAHDKKAQVYADDFETCQEIPCCPNALAVSITVDGKSVILPTDDHLIYYDVESNRIYRRSEWPMLMDQGKVYSYGPPLFRHLSILWNSDLLAFPTYRGGGIWRPSRRAYTQILDSYEPHVLLDRNRRYGLIGSVDGNADKRIQRFFQFSEDGSARLIRNVPVIDDWYFAAAVDTQGTLVVQDDDGLVLTSLDGHTQAINLSADIGKVSGYSPDNQRLVFSNRKRREISILDLATQKVVSSFSLQSDELLEEIHFQDNDHLILLIDRTKAGRQDRSVSGFLTRWNWRTGAKLSLSAGSLDAAETTFWLRLIWTAFAIWLLLLVFRGFILRRLILLTRPRLHPWLDFFLASLFIFTVTATRVWSKADRELVNLTIASAILFGLINLLVFSLALSSGRWMSKTPWFIFVIAIFSLGVRRLEDHLDTSILVSSINSSITGGVVLLLMLTWFLIPRRRKWRLDYPNSIATHGGPQKISQATLKDGVWLTASFASLFAVWGGEEYYGLDIDNIVAVLLPCAGYTVVAATVTWLVFGSRSDWGKYLFAAVTIVPALLYSPLFTATLLGFLFSSLSLLRMHGYHLRSLTE